MPFQPKKPTHANYLAGESVSAASDYTASSEYYTSPETPSYTSDYSSDYTGEYKSSYNESYSNSGYTSQTSDYTSQTSDYTSQTADYADAYSANTYGYTTDNASADYYSTSAEAPVDESAAYTPPPAADIDYTIYYNSPEEVPPPPPGVDFNSYIDSIKFTGQ